MSSSSGASQRKFAFEQKEKRKEISSLITENYSRYFNTVAWAFSEQITSPFNNVISSLSNSSRFGFTGRILLSKTAEMVRSDLKC